MIESFISDVKSNRSKAGGDSGEVSQSSVTLIWSIAVSIFCVGGMIGGSASGIVANKLGRKGGLLLNNLFVFASALLQGR